MLSQECEISPGKEWTQKPERDDIIEKSNLDQMSVVNLTSGLDQTTWNDSKASLKNTN